MVALRLYTGDSRPTAVPKNTLASVWRETVRPRLLASRRALSTLEDYDRAVRVWCEVTGDPDLGGINEQLLDDFTTTLGDRLKPRTINKYTTYLQSVLDACGRDSTDRRSSRGRPLQLLDRVPKFQLQEEDSSRVRPCPAVTEVASCIESSRVARHPTRQPGLRWSLVFQLLDWCGPRRNDLFCGLRLSNSIQDRRCPVESIDLEWEWGWLSWIPEKTKRTKQRPHVVPLSPALAIGLRQVIRPTLGDPPLLGFTDAPVQWYRELYRIQQAAGLPKRYGFHSFRKRCNITWNRYGDGVGAAYLCHAAKGVNARSYSEAAEVMLLAAQARLKAE